MQRIRPTSASQQIYDSLRERIITLELAPGLSLSRAEIAGDYGVSQTPVRDAMMKLEEDGLLAVFPQSKTEVSRIDLNHAKETQFLRLSLELEVTRTLALDNDKSTVEQARKILLEQQDALSEMDIARFARLDREFHLSLCKAVGVANLGLLVAGRSGHIDRLRNLNLPDPGKTANILDLHKRILVAIQHSDAEGVEMAVREHLSGTLASVDEIKTRFPMYF